MTTKPKATRAKKPKACTCGVCVKAAQTNNAGYIAKQKAKCHNR